MAKKSKDSGEYEHHVVGVRLRVVGTGELDLALADLQDVQVQDLVPITMAATTRFEPFRLANLQSQRIRLVGKTTEIDETFIIQRIIIFGKPVAQEYPA